MKRLFVIILLLAAFLVSNAQTVGGGGSARYQHKKTSTAANRSHRSSNRNVFRQEFMFMLNYAYANAPQHSVGLTIGQNKLGGTPLGWYINLMSGFNFNFSTQGQVGKGGAYDAVSVPFFSGKEQRTRLSASLGMTVNMVIPLYFYIGAGYGLRTLTWETVGGDWMTYSPTSYSGANVDMGFLFNIKGFAISAGYSTINFKYHEVKVGIGGIFKKKAKKPVATPAPTPAPAPAPAPAPSQAPSEESKSE